MTLDDLRALQHDDEIRPADVELMTFLGHVTPAQAYVDITRGFSDDEADLYHFHRRSQ